MKPSRVHSILNAIAGRAVPDDTDIWPALNARLPKGAIQMRLQTKWSWSLALVLLALALLTTVAYALYRYFNDPGLQAAQDAGLITDVNTTAEPNLLTPAPPFVGGPGQAVQVGSRQTVEGVGLTLDWVYVEDARQAFGLSATGLKAGMRLGVPRMTFADVVPEWYSGAIFSLEGDDLVRGTYLAHQMVRPDGHSGGRVDVQVDIPLLAWNNGDPAELTTFHFEVPQVEITVPWGGGGSNQYAVTINGLEMRMPVVTFAPNYTEVRLCYAPPSGEEWMIDKARAQFGDAPALAPDRATAMDAQVQLTMESGETCQDVNFPLAAPGKDTAFFVTADGLAARAGSARIDSAWQFSTYLPGDLHIGGLAESTPETGQPLASQTVGDLTATLEWAYVDSNRMAFRLHFAEWQPEYAVSYVKLRLADGTELNVGANWGPEESDPATALVSLTPATAFKEPRLKGQLVVDLVTSLAAGAPLIEFAFDIDLPVNQARTLQVGKTVSAGGTDMILQAVRSTPSYTVVYLCYPKPMPGDWGIDQASTLQLGGVEAGMAEYAMLYDSDYGDVGKGLEPGWKPAIQNGRCIRVGFPVGYHGGPESLVLRIDSLQVSMPEVLREEDVQPALETLRLEGIYMDWMTFTGSGGGGGGPVYKQLPEGMTEQQAYQRFIEALGFVHTGPWVFTVPINP